MEDPQNQTVIDSYISGFEGEIRDRLTQIRDLLRSLVPEPEETLGYGIPTFKYKGRNLIHFAAFKAHIGLYPGPAAIEPFKDELGDFPTSKGTIQMPNHLPLPLDLIRKITLFRIQAEDDRKRTKTTSRKS